MKRKLYKIFIILLTVLLASCEKNTLGYADIQKLIHGGVIPTEIPSYDGEIYTVLNGNAPYFDLCDKEYEDMEYYSPLDRYGRVGVCFAIIGQDSMPTKEREGIGMIKPTGWHTVRYDDLIEGKYLYNRCHLIGYQLTGENANEKNLMTGTRYFNVEGMLPFENEVASYIRKTGNHVLYRITPVFMGGDMLARGVIMEALSVEDGGEGIKINVFIHNIQPSVAIDYSDGTSSAEQTEDEK